MDEIRARLDDYFEARDRARFEFYRGESASLDLDRIDDTYGDITDGEALTRARAERDDASEPWKARWQPLIDLLEATLVARRARPSLVDLAQREAAQRTTVGDTERAVFTWRRRRGTATDAVERRRIQDALDDAWSELDPLRRELVARTGEAVSELGHESVGAWNDARTPAVDRAAWVARATTFLETTEVLYVDRLHRDLKNLGLDPRRATPADLSHLARLSRHEDLFPARRVIDGVDFTIEGIGKKLADLDLAIDSDRRTRKHPQALGFSPRVPGEIHIVVGLRGGVGDLRILLQQLGRALAHMFVSESLDTERRRAHDPTLLTTWGLLLRNRVSDLAWIESGPPARSGHTFLHDVRFIELMELRSVAAQVRWEDQLDRLPAGDDPTDLGDLYVEEMNAATGVQNRPSTALVGRELRAPALARFRAACLEAQLAEFLRTEFGDLFLRERATFALLAELWNTGGTYDADDVSSELGLGPIGLDQLLTRIVQTAS